jgi:hypothetical protein
VTYDPLTAEEIEPDAARATAEVAATTSVKRESDTHLQSCRIPASVSFLVGCLARGRERTLLLCARTRPETGDASPATTEV